eukprot:scaffold18540_cov144-Isochrysis_galbana.AAC.2
MRSPSGGVGVCGWLGPLVLTTTTSFWTEPAVSQAESCSTVHWALSRNHTASSECGVFGVQDGRTRWGRALKNSVTIATLPFSVIAEVVAVDVAIDGTTAFVTGGWGARSPTGEAELSCAAVGGDRV